MGLLLLDRYRLEFMSLEETLAFLSILNSMINFCRYQMLFYSGFWIFNSVMGSKF